MKPASYFSPFLRSNFFRFPLIFIVKEPVLRTSNKACRPYSLQYQFYKPVKLLIISCLQAFETSHIYYFTIYQYLKGIVKKKERRVMPALFYSCWKGIYFTSTENLISSGGRHFVSSHAIYAMVPLTVVTGLFSFIFC